MKFDRHEKTAVSADDLARRLDRVLGSSATVLHDRCVRDGGGHIDHLVVAASGVWVVIASHDDGRVVVGDDVGPTGRTAAHDGMSTSDASATAVLTVGGRDQSPRMVEARERSHAVGASLESAGILGAPVHAVLCLVDAEWDFFVSPVRVGSVLVTWPSELVDDIRLSHRWDPAAMARASMHLRAAVPANAR